jgi:8-oxo-dGTP pyrophosphatase MutT (NUDIX family)
MEPTLEGFIASGTLLCTTPVTWGNGALGPALAYQHTLLPPLDHVSSVRAIVFRGNEVLTVIEPNGRYYIFPGGRREKGEGIEDTLRREVLEETGWTLSGLEPLGFMLFHHRGERPPDYPYPYPDFLWPIFMARAGTYSPDALQPDDYVAGSDFLAIDEVKALPLDGAQKAFLDVALEVRGVR